MAAGYISSTSGIGVADPYDAGIYEAQQDALNRIEREQLRAAKEQAAKAEQAKALIGDLKADTGYLPEDSEAIKNTFNNAVKARSRAYQILSTRPNSQEAKEALDAAKAAEMEYKTIFNASKQDKDALDEMFKGIKEDDDIDDLKAKAAKLRTTPIDQRGALRPELFKIKKQPTLQEAVGEIFTTEKGAFAERQVGKPSIEKIDGRDYEVSEMVNVTPDQAKAFARSAFRDNTKNIRNSATKVYKMAIENGTAASDMEEAKTMGFDVQDPNEMAAFYVMQEFMNRQTNEKAYKELKMSEADKEELKLRNKMRFEDFKGAKEAEDALGFLARMTKIYQKDSRELAGVQFVDPRTKEKRFYLGQKVGAPIGNYTPKIPQDDGTVANQLDKSGEPIVTENKIEFVTVGKDGIMKYATTETIDAYRRKLRDSPFIPTTPEQLTDVYLQGKGKDSDKLIASKNEAIKKFLGKDGKIDYSKIYKTTESDIAKFNAKVDKPFVVTEKQGVVPPSVQQQQTPQPKTEPEKQAQPKMITVVLNGKEGQIPEDKLADFLKKYPQAKRK
jgi:hypothetical protein